MLLTGQQHNVNPDRNACHAKWCGILQELVEEESLHYSDIIQEGFVDSYNNLTLKSVMMLKWVLSNCRSVRYIMKTDDDMFVNINNLVRLLKGRNMSNLLVGALICGARPIADTQNKWWVSAAFIDMNCLFKGKGVFWNFCGCPYLCMCTFYTSACDIMRVIRASHYQTCWCSCYHWFNIFENPGLVVSSQYLIAWKTLSTSKHCSFFSLLAFPQYPISLQVITNSDGETVLCLDPKRYYYYYLSSVNRLSFSIVCL